MSLLNPAILSGLALAAIPVIMHLLMRQRPKKLLFPALRLIQVRRKNNVRRLRLRHIWLLLLRVAVIGLLVMAIARPSLPAANYRPSLRETITLTALFLMAAGAYWGVLRNWQRERQPHHVLTYKRSVLRGAIVTALAVLCLLFVAWPYQQRISAEITSPVPNSDHNLPVAGVFLFDTSLSMGYRFNSKTRLEVAQEIAAEHLEKLPSGSRIGVADTSTSNPVLFQAEPAAAQSRIESLKPKPVSLALNDRLRAALALQEEDYRRTFEVQTSVPEDRRSDRYLREVYILTDFAASGWRIPDSGTLKSELERLPWVQVYLIDVGAEQPTNVGISGFRLSSQTVPVGGELAVDVALESVGVESSEPVVELHVQNDKGTLVKREQHAVRLEGASQVGVTFAVPGIVGPITHGEIRIVTSDPFPADDVRFFTVAAAKPPEVLIVSETRDEAFLWSQILAPSELERLGKARYQCTQIPTSALAETDLHRFEIVCLVNVRSLPDSNWNTLAGFVQTGGGLAVILGRPDVDPVSYNREVAQTLLPAKLAGHIKLPAETRLDLKAFSHPILSKFEHFEGGFGDLATVKVERCWRVDLNEGASAVVRYTDDRATPALIERLHGRGRTLMLTTAVDRAGWNNLALAGYRFLVLADQMMQHLGHRADNVYNYAAGDEVVLHLDPASTLRRYLLRKPGFEQLPGDVPPGSETLTLRDADQVGQFEVISAENEPPYASGFSVNGRGEESRFDRMGASELDNLLGKDRYSTAQNIDGLTRSVGERRLGKEMYGFMVVFLMMAFCAEHFVANRFYDTEEQPTPAARSVRST